MWLRHASRIPRRPRSHWQGTAPLALTFRESHPDAPAALFSLVGVLEDTLGNHSRAEPWHKAAIDRGAFLAARHTSQSRGHAPPDTTL